MNTTPATLRFLLVVKLRSLGPSGRVRGSFVAEPTGDGQLVRNRARRRWNAYTVDLLDENQVADWRGALPADLEIAGVRLPDGHVLA